MSELIDETSGMMAFIIAWAPKSFPFRDYLKEQSTLERAFAALSRSLIQIDCDDKSTLREIEDLVNQSFAAFKSDDEKGGRAALNKTFDLLPRL